MDIDTILRDATARPWKVTPECAVVDSNNTRIRMSGVSLPMGYIPQSDAGYANAKLTVLAVNSFEAQRAVIGQLVGALDWIASSDSKSVGECRLAALDALAAAKKVMP